jgi:hypothetical protein
LVFTFALVGPSTAAGVNAAASCPGAPTSAVATAFCCLGAVGLMSLPSSVKLMWPPGSPDLAPKKNCPLPKSKAS